MATAVQKITLSASRDIPFNKLVLSQSNVRRVKAGVSIEELAEDIARRTLLQSLNVRAVLDAEGKETGMFEIPAGGRRYRALELLVKQKRLAKTAPVPCVVREGGFAEEDSLAENVQRVALHPLDQFRAFQTLRDKGLGEEEIAARFFVSPTVVKQRLRLAAVSEKLLEVYAEDGMTLEQLRASFDALQAENEALEEQYAEAGELPDEIDQRLGEIEAALAAFENRPVRYDPAEIASAGAFVSIDGEGALRIERGFVRPEDEAPAEPVEGGEGDAPRSTSEMQNVRCYTLLKTREHGGIHRKIPEGVIVEVDSDHNFVCLEKLTDDPGTLINLPVPYNPAYAVVFKAEGYDRRRGFHCDAIKSLAETEVDLGLAVEKDNRKPILVELAM